MNTYLGVAGLIEPDDIDDRLVADARLVYCEGYLWDLPETKAGLIKAMEVAHANDGEVSFTLSDSFCVDRHRGEFLDLVRDHVDVLFANEVEILSLYEVDDWREAADRIADVVAVTCLTRSEHGSVVIAGGERIEVPAAPVEHVVDTTGAGDLYAAGFLFGYTQDFGLKQAAALGSLAAAEVISHIGARPQVSLEKLAEGRRAPLGRLVVSSLRLGTGPGDERRVLSRRSALGAPLLRRFAPRTLHASFAVGVPPPRSSPGVCVQAIRSTSSRLCAGRLQQGVRSTGGRARPLPYAAAMESTVAPLTSTLVSSVRAG